MWLEFRRSLQYPSLLQLVGVRGMPERDTESLGVMGKGAGGGQEILPPSPPPPSSSPPQSGYLVIIVSLCFLTHMRDIDTILAGNRSQSRCGSFLFSPKMPAAWALRPSARRRPRPWARGPSTNATCHLVKVKSNLSFGQGKIQLVIWLR